MLICLVSVKRLLAAGTIRFRSTPTDRNSYVDTFCALVKVRAASNKTAAYLRIAIFEGTKENTASKRAEYRIK